MIAPRLQRMRYLVEADRPKNFHAIRCRRELRALLAVARAAKRVADTTFPPDSWSDKAWEAMDRALDRLERARKEKP